MVKKFGENPLLLIAPDLARLAPKLSGWSMLLELVQKFQEIIREHVNRHQKEQSEDDSPRDFIDAYLKKIKSTIDSSSSFYKEAGSKPYYATPHKKWCQKYLGLYADLPLICSEVIICRPYRSVRRWFGNHFYNPHVDCAVSFEISKNPGETP